MNLFHKNFVQKIFVEQKSFSTENDLNQIFTNQTINLMGFDTIELNLVYFGFQHHNVRIIIRLIFQLQFLPYFVDGG